MTCGHCGLEDRGGLHSSEFCIEVLAEVIRRVPVTGGMIRERGPVDHDAYRAGRCITCPAPHSAGRPRCGSCHQAYEAGLPRTGEPELERGRLARCAVAGCHSPAVPGAVICGPHRRARC